MPATSRQTRSGRHPLGQRLGGLALEVDDLPALDGAQRLAEVEVAVHPLGGGGLAGGAQPGDAAEGLAQRVGVLGSSSGHDRQRDLEPGQHRVGERGQVVGAPRLGGELLGEHVVHLRGGQARAARPRRRSRRRPRRRAGRPRRTGRARWPARGPSRRWRCAGTAAASRAAPARRARVEPVELEPAVERGDVVAALLGERLVDHDVGVAARGDLAEHLHQGVLAERHRGVALLAGEQRRVRARGRGRGRAAGGSAGRRARPSPSAAAVERLQPERGGLPVVHRVVGDAPCRRGRRRRPRRRPAACSRRSCGSA